MIMIDMIDRGNKCRNQKNDKKNMTHLCKKITKNNDFFSVGKQLDIPSCGVIPGSTLHQF